MATTITVTKQDDYNFVVTFSDAINGPGDTEAGGEVPVSWLASVLEYYHQNADPTEGLPEKHRKLLPW